MAIDTNLTATERARLLGASTLKRFMSAVPISGYTQATAQINQASFSYPVITLTVDNTSAAWSSVAKGQAVIIHRDATITPYNVVWRGRVRKAGTGSTLEIQETSEGDWGAIPYAAKVSQFLDNLYITVLKRRDIWSIIPYIDYPGTGEIFEDRDFAYSSSSDFNKLPPPTVNITINGKAGNWKGFVDSISVTYATLVFVVTATVWPTSSSISTYSASIPGTWTVTAGSVSTATFTARVPVQGDVPYAVTFTATDNNSKPFTAERMVWVYDYGDNYPTEIPIAEIGSDSRDRTGRRMTFTLNGQALANIEDGSQVEYWETPLWNGLAVDSATRSFTGWMLKQTKNTSGGLTDAQIEVVGPTGLLRRAESQYFEVASNPSTWQQVTGALSYVDFLLYWLVAQRAGNLLRMFDYNRLGLSNLAGRMGVWRINKGTIVSQLQEMAGCVGANFGCDSTGSMFVRYHPSKYLVTGRNATFTFRTELNKNIYRSLTVSREMQHRYGWVRGEGFVSDTVTTTPLRSIAPGNSPGQGPGETVLQGQIVESQGDLNLRVGHEYAYLNNPYQDVNVVIESNYDVIEPAQMPLVTVDAPASYQPDNAVWPPLIDMTVILSTAITSTSSTTVISSVPLQPHMIIKIDDEYMLVTEVSSTTSTVERGYLDSTPATHLINTLIYRGLACVPFAINKRHLPVTEGSADIEMSAELESAGVVGLTVLIPTANNAVYGGYSVPLATPTDTSSDIEGITSDGGTVFVIRSTKIGITVTWFNGSPAYIDVTRTGLSGTILDFALDPFSERLTSTNKTGPLAAYCVTTAGVYYITNILKNSSVWVQQSALTYATAVLRCSITVSGGIVVHGLPAVPGQPTCRRFTDNGATIAWTQTVGSNSSVGAFVGMDIDQSGSDEVLASGCVGTTGYVYRISNGGSPSQLAATAFASVGADEAAMAFIQKPLKRPDGSDNSSTGASEFFVYAANQQDGANTTRAFKKTEDGGATITDISPAITGTKYTPAVLTSSIVFTTDSSIMALTSNDTGQLFTSTTGGASWTTQSATAHDYGSGFFPRTQSGNYAVYLAGSSKVGYSNDFGVTTSEKTGDFSSSVGGSGGFLKAIPLY